MSTVKNFNVGGVNYSVQDTKATPFLSSADESTLLSDGTYRGDTVANGTIFAKPDGTLNTFSATPISPTWVSNTTFRNANLQAYNGNTIVTLTGSNTQYVQVSTNGGSTWTQREAVPSTWSSNQGMGLCFHKGYFYVLGRYSFSSSPDGITWTLLKSGDGQSAAYDTKLGGYLLSNGTIMVRLNTGLPYYYDEDSAAWVQVSSSSSVWATSGTVDPITKIFYAAGTTGGVVLKSADGKTWTTTTRPTTSDVTVAAYNNLVLAASTSAVYYSADGGSTWTQSFATNSGYVRVLDGVFIIYVSGETKNYISADGYTWTAVSGGSVNPMSIVTYNGKFRGSTINLPTTLQYAYALTPLSYTASEVDTALGEKQTAAIVASSDPTASLRKSLGDRYLNSTEGTTFVCTQEYEAPSYATNYTTNGTVNVTADKVATFNNGAYIRPPQNWTYSGSPWAVEMKFTTPTSYASGNGRCLFRWGSTDCMIFLNSAGYIVACGWSSGSQPRVAVSLNTTYWLRVEYDGSQINLYLSTTGTFPSTPTASSTSPAYWPGNDIVCYLGGKASEETYNGSIDLTAVKWYSNGTLVWEAITQTGGQDAEWTGLQNKLIAGTGIDITDNVISATGGGGSGDVYTAGTGISFADVSDHVASADKIGSVAFTAGKFTPSSSNYLQLTSNSVSGYTGSLFTGNYNWAWTVKFKSPADLTSMYRICTMGSATNNFNIWCSITEGTDPAGVIHLGVNTSNGWINVAHTPMSSGTILQPSTWYWVRISRDITQSQYKLEISTDGINWIVEATTSSTYGLYNTNSNFYISQVTSSYLPLEYDLSGCSFTSNYGTGIDWVAYAPMKQINNTGLINTATDSNSLAVGPASTTTPNSTAIGIGASVGYLAEAVGYQASAGGFGALAVGTQALSSGVTSVAIGFHAGAYADNSIQIGYGTNNTANTMNVGLSDSVNVQLLDSSGNIPAARLSNIYEVVQTMPASPISGKIYFVTGS